MIEGEEGAIAFCCFSLGLQGSFESVVCSKVHSQSFFSVNNYDILVIRYFVIVSVDETKSR